MKKDKCMNKRIVLIMALLLMAVGIQAQSGLAVNDIFERRVIPHNRMVETKVRGRTLSKYKLTLYRSVRFEATAEELDRVRRLFDSDAKAAMGSSYHKKGSRSKTQMLNLAPNGSSNRFLCLKYDTKDSGYGVTMVYMEGSVGSLGELRKLLENE